MLLCFKWFLVVSCEYYLLLLCFLYCIVFIYIYWEGGNIQEGYIVSLVFCLMNLFYDLPHIFPNPSSSLYTTKLVHTYHLYIHIYISACCSFAYLLFGMLCFDRFTSRAFLSTQDPVASTAIPSGNKYDAPSLS